MTVGIVGAGQLARMTYEAGTRLDVHLRVLARDRSDTAASVFADVAFGSPDDPEDLERFAASCDVMTFDHELVDVDAIHAIEARGRTVRPHGRTISISTNKQRQREVFGSAGFPLPDHRVVQTVSDVTSAADEHGWPVVVKAVRGGYDGRGVWTVGSAEDADGLVHEALDAGVSLFVEPRLELDHELAVLVARRPSGDAIAYPVVETVQVEGICHEVLAPARVPQALMSEAEKLGLAVAEETDVIGMLTVEMFVSDGRLLLNEIATRPHNAGHFTIDGAATSQFENHLRAVADLPLGSTELRSPAAAMANVIGTDETGDPRDRLADALAVQGAHVHLYGKQARRGRKIGHVTVTGDDLDDLRRRAKRAAVILAGSEMGGPR